MCKTTWSCVIAGLSLISAGCQQPVVDRDVPDGLERLGMLAGTWKSTSTAYRNDDAAGIACAATARLRWDLDGQYLVERTEYDLGDLGRSAATGLWTWDEAGRVYRMWHFDSDGGYAEGTATYDATTRVWHLASQTVNRNTGARSAGSGTMQFTGDHEKAFDWTSHPRAGSSDAYRVEGTSRRVGR